MTAPAVARPGVLRGGSSAGRRFVPPGPGGRDRQAAPLGAVLFTTLVAHVAVGPICGAGGGPDVLLVGVTAVAAGRGPRAGAAFGFASGLGADLFLATPPGTSALAFTSSDMLSVSRAPPGRRAGVGRGRRPLRPYLDLLRLPPGRAAAAGGPRLVGRRSAALCF